MENRRQKIYEWYLTRKGWVIGSCLCVLTFALMTVAFGLIAYSVSRFGSSILTEPDKNYYRTEYYENALKQDMKNLLQDAKKAYLQSKQALFGEQRSLLFISGKNALQIIKRKSQGTSEFLPLSESLS